MFISKFLIFLWYFQQVKNTPEPERQLKFHYAWCWTMS